MSKNRRTSDFSRIPLVIISFFILLIVCCKNQRTFADRIQDHRFVVYGERDGIRDFSTIDSLNITHNDSFPVVRIYQDRWGNFYPKEKISNLLLREKENESSLFKIFLHYPDLFLESARKFEIKNWPTVRKETASSSDSLVWSNFQKKIIEAKFQEIQDSMKGCASLTFVISGFNNHFCGYKGNNNIIKLAKIRKRVADFLILNNPGYRTCFVEVHWDATQTDHQGFKTSLNFATSSAISFDVGMKLRVLLNHFSADLPIYMISHSMGANVITQTLFQQTSKVSKLRHGKLSDFELRLNAMAKDSDYFTPRQKITVALGAPAITGVTTFMDFMNRSKGRMDRDNFKIIIVYDENDPANRKILGRPLLSFIDKISNYTLSYHFSSTSLGCNGRGEITKVQHQNIKNRWQNNFAFVDFTTPDRKILHGKKNGALYHEVTEYMKSSQYDTMLRLLYNFQPGFYDKHPPIKYSANLKDYELRLDSLTELYNSIDYNVAEKNLKNYNLNYVNRKQQKRDSIYAKLKRSNSNITLSKSKVKRINKLKKKITEKKYSEAKILKMEAKIVKLKTIKSISKFGNWRINNLERKILELKPRQCRVKKLEKRILKAESNSDKEKRLRRKAIPYKHKERRIKRWKGRILILKSEATRRALRLDRKLASEKALYIKDIDTVRYGLLHIMVELENKNTNFSYDHLSNGSLEIIQSIDEINLLETMLRAVEDYNINDDTVGVGMNSVMQAKFKDAISLQMNIIAKRDFVWYNYATDSKQPLDAININTANDLFTPMGLAEQFSAGAIKSYENKRFFFQGNDDRDYTGGLDLEIATNYLKIRRQRPVKSYQTVFLGRDFYTPYFRDTSIFPNQDSFNILDRPFASFQYLGYTTHCLSRNNGFRWDLTCAFGKVGGTSGKTIQTLLHQDVSYSPRPIGWGAQISNGGRLGFSIEYKPEYLLKSLSVGHKNSSKPKSGFFTSAIGDISLGTYMTYASVGLQFSNKNFKTTNTNYAVLRNKHSIRKASFVETPYFMWNLRVNYRRVTHNTMLEGYGIFSTTEPDWRDPASNTDPLTPSSKYFLSWKQVERDVCTIDFTVSKQARYFTFFYKFSMISPETNLGKIGIDYPNKNHKTEYDLSGRWHHWATLGVCFRID